MVNNKKKRKEKEKAVRIMQKLCKSYAKNITKEFGPFYHLPANFSTFTIGSLGRY
jgi:hypothetical protein